MNTKTKILSGLLMIAFISIAVGLGNEEVVAVGGNLILNSTADIVLDPDGNDILPGSDSSENFGATANRWLTSYFDAVDTPVIDSVAGLELQPVGDITLDPAGNDVLPGGDSADNLGSAGVRWLVIYGDTIDANTALDANLIQDAADIDVKASGDNDDYIRFDSNLISNQPMIRGIGGNLNLNGETNMTIIAADDNNAAVTFRMGVTAGNDNVVEPYPDETIGLGNDANEWKDVWALDTSINHGDIAENHYVNDSVEAGDLICLDTNGDILKCANAYNPKVLGVVSTEPGITMNSWCDVDKSDYRNCDENGCTLNITLAEACEGFHPIALAGLTYAKVKCDTPIDIGDPLVSVGASMPGYSQSMYAQTPTSVGQIWEKWGADYAKAKQPCASGTGLIEIWV